jgi:predicted nucleic acid-binding protein
MKAYADTSFLLRVLVRDVESEPVDSAHRALGRPCLLYSSLHALETGNAIRLRTFFGSNGAIAAARKQLAREEQAAFRRLRLSLATGRFIAAQMPWEEAAKEALRLSEAHCHRIGLRAFDLLHVAACLEMNCRLFLTCDIRQAALAKAAGLKVTLVQSRA